MEKSINLVSLSPPQHHTGFTSGSGQPASSPPSLKHAWFVHADCFILSHKHTHTPIQSYSPVQLTWRFYSFTENRFVTIEIWKAKKRKNCHFVRILYTPTNTTTLPSYTAGEKYHRLCNTDTQILIKSFMLMVFVFRKVQDEAIRSFILKIFSPVIWLLLLSTVAINNHEGYGICWWH